MNVKLTDEIIDIFMLGQKICPGEFLPPENPKNNEDHP